MIKRVSKVFKGVKKLGLVTAVLSSACTRCPESEIRAIYDAMPDPETKNDGYDLRGWQYTKTTSEKSGQTYYYYHLSSKKPDAPVFLLVHGLFLDGRTFINFGPLADDFDLVALELPHQSPFYRGKRADFPELLQDFIDTMGLESLYLGGVSLGGQIAMFYAEQNPASEILGLALISTDMVKTDRELKKAKRAARMIARLTRNDDDRMLCVLSKLSERKRKGADAETRKAMEIFQLKRPSFYKEVMSIADDMEAPPDLTVITPKTIIVHGDEDTTVSIEKSRHLMDHIPNAVFNTIEGGEHTVAYTRGNQIADMIRDYFRPDTGI